MTETNAAPWESRGGVSRAIAMGGDPLAIAYPMETVTCKGELSKLAKKDAALAASLFFQLNGAFQDSFQIALVNGSGADISEVQANVDGVICAKPERIQ